MMYELMTDIVNWRYYLDSNENSRAEIFLKYRGDNLFKLIINSMKETIRNRQNSIVMLVHPNVSKLVEIPKNEYIDLLDFAIKWYESNEEYEMCGYINNFKKKIASKIVRNISPSSN